MVVNYLGLQMHHQADSIEADQFTITLMNKGEVVASYPRCNVASVLNGQAVIYPTQVYPL